MKASTRIRVAMDHLLSIVTLPSEQNEKFLHELKHCIAVEVQNIVENYSKDQLASIYWFNATLQEQLPVSTFSIAECRRCIERIQVTSNPHKFLEAVNKALHWLVVYQIGWSEVIEDQRLEVYYSEQEAEIIVSDVNNCYRLNGEVVESPISVRPATKAELVAQDLYNYDQQLD